jgi:uncharacterized membrane protein
MSENPEIIRPDDIKENQLIAALSYIWIVGIFIYLFKKDSPFVQFHAKQSLLLTLLTFIFSLLPLIGSVFWIAAVVLYIVGFFQALSGQYWDMPYLSKYAKKIPN